MNVKKVADAVVEAIDEPENAGRVLLVYVSQTSGIITFRPGHGFVQIGGGADDRPIGAELEQALAQLWPDAPRSIQQMITIVGHGAGRRRLSDFFGGGADDDDKDG